MGAGTDYEPNAKVGETEVSRVLATLNLTKHARGIAMGTRSDFEEMNRYLEENSIHFKPLLVDVPFTFADAQKAYERLASGKFYGKIVIKTE